MVVTIGPGEVLASSVADGDVPGVVALAATHDGVIFADAFGERELGSGVDMTLDTVCWIASMTKALTSTAALQQVEQGRLTSTNRSPRSCPSSADVQVLDGFDADGTPRLRPPARPITLRHLLTHTAGFGYDIWNADMLRYAQHDRPARHHRVQERRAQHAAGVRPGRALGIRHQHRLGRQGRRGGQRPVARGLPAHERLRRHSRCPTPASSSVRSSARAARACTAATRTARSSRSSSRCRKTPEFFMGGGGLYSTGPDYLRFLRALLGNGDARRCAHPAVRDRRRHVPQPDRRSRRWACCAPSIRMPPTITIRIRACPSWGLGFMITTEAAPGGRSAGSLAWAGLANTYYWIDRERGITGLIMTQILPFVDARVCASTPLSTSNVRLLRPMTTCVIRTSRIWEE